MNKSLAGLFICSIMATGMADRSWADTNQPPLTSGQKSEADRVAFEKAVNAGTDAALIEFMQTSKTGSYDEMALVKLKSYKSVPNKKLIPWVIIPSVYTGAQEIGSPEGFHCAINMDAFSSRVTEQCNGTYLAVGPIFYFKPDTTTLLFKKWTIFDKYLVKGTALVKLDGLSFTDDSVVLEKNTGGK
jgi:hypothetical protein